METGVPPCGGEGGKGGGSGYLCRTQQGAWFGFEGKGDVDPHPTKTCELPGSRLPDTTREKKTPPWKTCANDPDPGPVRHPKIEKKKNVDQADRVVVEEEDVAHVHPWVPRTIQVVADRSDHQGSFPCHMHRRTWPVMQVDGQEHHTMGTYKQPTKRARPIQPNPRGSHPTRKKKDTHTHTDRTQREREKTKKTKEP